MNEYPRMHDDTDDGKTRLSVFLVNHRHFRALMFIQYFIVLPECLFFLWRCWEAHHKLNEVQKVELMLSVSAEASPLSWITLGCVTILTQYSLNYVASLQNHVSHLFAIRHIAIWSEQSVLQCATVIFANGKKNGVCVCFLQTYILLKQKIPFLFF